MAENQVSVELTIETVQALKDIAKTQTAISKMAKDSAAGLGKVESSFGSLGSTIAGVFGGGLLLKGFELFTSALSQVPVVIGDVTAKGIEAETVSKQLGIALAQAGDASSETKQRFEELAHQLSILTGIDDDVIAGGVKLALQFGATAQEAEKIARAAADVAASGLLPFEDAVQQLSGTLNGVAPRAFAKSVEGIKGLSEESLKSGKAIDIVAAKFQGLAALNSGNLGVQVKNVSIAFENLEKSLGKSIAKSPELRAAFLTVNQILEKTIKFLDENGVSITRIVGDIVTVGVVSVQVFAEVYDGAARTFSFIFNVFKGVGDVVNIFIGSLRDVLQLLADFPSRLEALDFTGIFKNAEQATKDFVDSGNKVSETLDFSKPFTEALTASNEFYNSWLENLANIKTVDDENTSSALSNSANRQAASEAELQKQQELLIELQALKDEAAINDLARQQMLDEGLFTSAQTLAENRQQIALAEIDAKFKAEAAKNDLIKNGDEKALAQAKTTQARKNAIDKATTQFELEEQRRRQQNFKDSLGVIATLQSSGSKELFAIGKAAAIATATIDGIQAVQKALASAPPPFNFAVAALVGTAQALNLSKIASAKPPGFADGGIVPGSSFSGDRVTARLNSGEMVLNSSQQAQLFNLANGGPAGSSIEGAIERLGNRIANMTIVVQANAREIARLVRDEKEAGFA